MSGWATRPKERIGTPISVSLSIFETGGPLT
ncbi:hypothetical protein GGE16_001540 [Rhizobium leguminosarum]|uniref:Uncharacterized protein n=1 Tax=Rhizobium leguminosarum TaxID=384 RepID=A0AAE2MHQ4_RHILE|nr:hypothetical protein [Rhizobium leguminosarum]MBB4433492.1 hypothetical protein [Rhizobium esperanzae]MBB4294379.1 hypothetical protein [Rhizobium leguminosarum]MBB4305776.1 hypothetical protein [Rhizobium leguminosarum]MBB4418647.1 hypothetical protein [Rhizobium leguminosarum]